MSVIKKNAPGSNELLMGNEAIARGALEAGVQFAAAYPGNPSSEIIGTLAQVADDLGIYVEWSVNEKVALEAAASASFSGLRAISAMKQNGVNVASDFILNLNLSGVGKGGLVLVAAVVNSRPIYPTAVTVGEAEYPSWEKIKQTIYELARKAWFIDATEMALSYGSPIFTNIIMVGALAGTQLIPLERKAFEEIIRESFPAAQVADNLKAFKRGMEMTQGC